MWCNNFLQKKTVIICVVTHLNTKLIRPHKISNVCGKSGGCGNKSNKRKIEKATTVDVTKTAEPPTKRMKLENNVVDLTKNVIDLTNHSTN